MVPRPGWWGYKDQQTGRSYLMRYGHRMVVYKDNEIFHVFHETITDRRGVYYAASVIKTQKKARIDQNTKQC